MKLTVTLVDERYDNGQGLVSPRKTFPYDRVSLVDMDAPASVLAAVLRGIADDIAPPRYEGDFLADST